MRICAVIVLGVVSSGCASEPEPAPGSVGEALERRLRSIADVGDATPLAHAIAEVEVSPRSGQDAIDATLCDAVRDAAEAACQDVKAAGLGAVCRSNVAWFEAQGAYRCSARLLVTPTTRRMAQVVTFDLVTAPPPPPAECGNRRIDSGEECDDGNTELWDGCGPTCLIDEFEGCEAVIEHAFEIAKLAAVDRNGWSSPRSHVMVHEAARALTPVNAAACHQALATATDVCTELSTTMPFVGTCAPEVEHVVPPAGGAEACAVRLTVGFRAISPDDGVFTTRQAGLLSFTIR